MAIDRFNISGEVSISVKCARCGERAAPGHKCLDDVLSTNAGWVDIQPDKEIANEESTKRTRSK